MQITMQLTMQGEKTPRRVGALHTKMVYLNGLQRTRLRTDYGPKLNVARRSLS